MEETLVDVANAIRSGRTRSFRWLRCFVVNYRADFEFPSKFSYNGCNISKANGQFCAISTDSIDPCEHNRYEVKHSQRMYRFELQVTDRSPSPPLHVTVFDQAQVLLGISAEQLSRRSPSEQLAHLKRVTSLGTPVELNLSVKPDYRGVFVAIVQPMTVTKHIDQDVFDEIMGTQASSPTPPHCIDTFHTPRREVGGTGSTSTPSSGSQRSGRGGRSKQERLSISKNKLLEDLIDIIDLTKESD